MDQSFQNFYVCDPEVAYGMWHVTPPWKRLEFSSGFSTVESTPRLSITATCNEL